eukprot:CAMPEP_0172466170 /NCGR_PEP_ID=MMETSP1065-20121228/55426_1 /TAXON_ID=265537 /ORGANISM="Amphiprora paludosa, Strain CCMP125" /LENGTH=36 /DNA_ID= /DNA_START= /DNA_END= /DNA_ORIENTATION=
MRQARSSSSMIYLATTVLMALFCHPNVLYATAFVAP